MSSSSGKRLISSSWYIFVEAWELVSDLQLWHVLTILEPSQCSILSLQSATGASTWKIFALSKYQGICWDRMGCWSRSTLLSQRTKEKDSGTMTRRKIVGHCSTPSIQRSSSSGSKLLINTQVIGEYEKLKFSCDLQVIKGDHYLEGDSAKLWVQGTGASREVIRITEYQLKFSYV